MTPSPALIALNTFHECLTQWVFSSRDQFSLRNAADKPHELELLKPLGEFVLCLGILARRCPNEPAYVDAAQWAWDEFGEGELFIEILLARPDLLILSSVYANFHCLGLRHASLHKLLGRLSETALFRSIQFPNWRRLDLEYSMAKLNLLAISPETISHMWSYTCPEPWLIENDAAYALTHEVFYVTDFGQSSELVPRHVSEYLVTWLPAWFEIYRSQGNWDLCAELLMVAACLPTTALEFSAFGCLTDAVASEGFLPAPPEGGRTLKRSSDSDERQEFLTHYHTTLVGLLAAELWIQRLSVQCAGAGNGC